MPDAELGRLGPVTGRTPDVTITLTGLSYRETSKGRRYPYPDFGSDFIDALHKALVGPRRRGILRSKLVCPRCEWSLDGIAVGSVPFTTEVALTRIPPIRIDLEMAGMVCPGCSRSVVMIGDRDLQSDLSDALIDAFAQVGLVPG